MTLLKRGRFWHYDFQDGGQRYWGSTKETNKREAARFLERLRVDLRANKGSGRVTEKTFGEIVTMYEAERLPSLRSDGPVDSHKRLMRYLPATMMFHELTSARVNQMIRAMAHDGFAANTIRQDVSRLTVLSNWLASDHVAIRQPKLGKFNLPKRTRKTRVLHTQEEVDRLLAAALAHPDPDTYRMVVILLETGMRFGEMTNLTWDGIFLNEGRMTFYRPKTDTTSTVPISERLHAVLREMARNRDRTTPRVFPGWVDRHSSRPIQRVIERAGLNDPLVVERSGTFTTHSLRHSYGTHLIRSGVSVPVVARLMGHASITTTMGYVHLVAEDGADEAVAALNKRTAGPNRNGNIELSY